MNNEKLSTIIINQIIKECIELDATFTRFDILAEALERSCCIDEHDINLIISEYKYPLYYKQSEIRQNGILFNVMHPSDRYAELYEVPDIDAIRITNADMFSRPLTVGRKLPFKSTKRMPPDITIENTLPPIGNKEDYQLIEDFLGIPHPTIKRPMFNKNGRYSVPSLDVKMSGLNAGDIVYVIIGMGYVTLSTETPPESAMVNFGNSYNIGVNGTVTVDRYYNIRLKNKILFAAINAIPVSYGGVENEITKISSVKVQPISTTKTINLYPKI